MDRPHTGTWLLLSALLMGVLRQRFDAGDRVRLAVLGGDGRAREIRYEP